MEPDILTDMALDSRAGFLARQPNMATDAAIAENLNSSIL